MNDRKVYILGAGCSVISDRQGLNHGYPLAKDFLGDLKEYGGVLKERAKCDRLRQIVADTIAVMEKYQTPTIDRLVRRIAEEPGKIGTQSWIYDHPLNQPWKDKTVWADEQVLNAKIVTMAMFLEREEKVRETALCSYRDLLSKIFDGNRDLNSLATTSSRILSYNYDRLFEIAFADYFNFGRDRDVNCYGREFLNSGWDSSSKDDEKFASDRFCFLKMHGSATVWIYTRYGNPQYLPCGELHGTDHLINDDFFWPPGRKLSPWPSENPEPFIVFPHEKESVRSGGRPACSSYLKAIERQADVLIESAREIWAIGYSFDLNDRPSLMKLLLRSSKDCDINVWNPNAESICDELRHHYRDLAPRLKPHAKRF
jgi:hypothetical protein